MKVTYTHYEVAYGPKEMDQRKVFKCTLLATAERVFSAKERLMHVDIFEIRTEITRTKVS